MPRLFVVARNPEPDSTLPFLLRLPLGPEGVMLKGESWPRTAKVYCHRAEGWPTDPEVVEAVPVLSCERRGPAIDLVLDRARESRSQFVFTKVRGGRQAIFWQSARTTRQARPNVALPHRRSLSGALTILVDAHERYPWRFSHQQATTERRALPAGDYGVEADGRLAAVVERKSVADLASAATTGRLRSQLAGLAALPRAAVVVEERYSAVFRLQHVAPSLVADSLAELQVRYPTVPIVFAETRPLAEEWTYRFLGAAVRHLLDEDAAGALAADLAPGPDPSAPEHPRVLVALYRSGAQRGADERGLPDGVSTSAVRAWAATVGIPVSPRGRLSAAVLNAYRSAHGDH